MYPPSHALAGLAIGSVGKYFGYFNNTDIVLLTSIATLIDLDHYIYFICKHKSLNIFKAWDNAVKNRERFQRTAIHHIAGFIIFTLCLIGFFFINEKLAIILGAAYYSHYLLDYMSLPLKERLKFKIGPLKFNVTYQEIVVDVLLIVVLVAFWV
ncbi:MAG: metal-dependent hydrolase [Patescibacteria group bacterium]